jgi:hypothetical protein
VFGAQRLQTLQELFAALCDGLIGDVGRDLRDEASLLGGGGGSSQGCAVCEQNKMLANAHAAAFRVLSLAFDRA